MTGITLSLRHVTQCCQSVTLGCTGVVAIGRDVMASIFRVESVDGLDFRVSFTLDVLNERGAGLRCVYLQVWVISFNSRIINMKTLYT
jgi:hypothetical protein